MGPVSDNNNLLNQSSSSNKSNKKSDKNQPLFQKYTPSPINSGEKQSLLNQIHTKPSKDDKFYDNILTKTIGRHDEMGRANLAAIIPPESTKTRNPNPKIIPREEKEQLEERQIENFGILEKTTNRQIRPPSTQSRQTSFNSPSASTDEREIELLKKKIEETEKKKIDLIKNPKSYDPNKFSPRGPVLKSKYERRLAILRKEIGNLKANIANIKEKVNEEEYQKEKHSPRSETKAGFSGVDEIRLIDEQGQIASTKAKTNFEEKKKPQRKKVS